MNIGGMNQRTVILYIIKNKLYNTAYRYMLLESIVEFDSLGSKDSFTLTRRIHPSLCSDILHRDLIGKKSLFALLP